MRWIAFLILLAAVLVCGCSDQAPPPTETEAGKPAAVRLVADERPGRSLPDSSGVAPLSSGADEVVASLPPLSRQEAYEAALHEAIDLLAERKYREALATLEKAQKINDTGAVQREIDKVRASLAQVEAAEKAAADVRTVLESGRPEEAGRLASQALQQYGGGDEAERLAALKRQADALVTASADSRVRRISLCSEADLALRENNLRAAAVALEGALALWEDPDLRQKLDRVAGRLTRYDSLRAQAHRLRRDPSQLERAVALLREAEEVWDTLQVRQEIDASSLALARRRDRLSVADFEVRGGLGVSGAGRLVAEQLLPAFRTRFDLVERSQLGKVLEELRLETRDVMEDAAGRQELARLSRIRYLVVGSLTPVGGGVTVSARLIEVPTGLIVQTGVLSAPSVEALLPRLKELGALLMMSDEQKLDFESRVQASTLVIQPIEVPAVIVVSPPPPAEAPLPPPILTYTPRPPAFGGLVIEDFRALPPVVAAPPPPLALEVVIRREDPRRRRLLALSLELGDNLFRRGRCQEAQRHYQVALQLSGGDANVQVRVEQCRKVLPPPPPPAVEVVVPPPVRPRLAVFGFFVNCKPGLVPPAVGDWAADSLTSYFGGNYEVIERGEVCWYMGRLGVTMRDLMNDQAARVCLAQALNARFFVFGAIEPTASFNVSTHLMDAQTGARTGTGTIHVQDHAEMKLRMGELARQMGAAPAEQAKLAQQGASNEKALNEARKSLASGNYARAAETARSALKSNPDNVALKTLAEDADRKARQKALEEQRGKEARERAAAQEQARKQQEALARQTAEARVKAEREVREKGEALKREQAARNQKAAEMLRRQARENLDRGNLTGAVQSLQSAQALQPSDEGARALADARARAEKASKERAAAEHREHEAELQKQRDLAAARMGREKAEREKADAERRRIQAEKARADAEKKKAAEEALKHQEAERKKVLDEALRRQETERKRAAEEGLKRQEAEKKKAAEEALKRQEAERKKAAEEVQKRQEAEKKKAAEEALKRQEAERKKAAEEVQKRQEADKKKAAEEALKRQEAERKKAAEEVLKRQEAEKKKAAEEALKRQEAERKKAIEEEVRRNGEFARLVQQGQGAMATRRYADAVQAYASALKVKPADPGALKAQREAQQALDVSRRPTPPPPPVTPPKPPVPAVTPPPPAAPAGAAEHARQMQAGASFEKVGKWAEAMTAYQAALRAQPGEPRATAALRGAQFQQHRSAGRNAHAARKFPEAVREYEEALKLQPGNAEVQGALQRARTNRP